MRALVFGGTGFVGRHVVQTCLDRGHEVTLFCRGLSDAHAFPGVARVLGDRGRPADLTPLEAHSFDVVFDTSGYMPSEVRASVDFATRAGAHYVFVSTVSVYADLSRPRNEESPVHELPDADSAALAPATYGGLKVACERAVQGALGPRALVARPGRILGPHDSDPRLPWLLRRVARGGEVLAPGHPEVPVQIVDARDLALFLVEGAERRLSGTFNTIGPPFAAGRLYEALRAVTGSDARFTWVPEEVLVAHAVGPYTEAPFWLPRAYENAQRTDASRAVAEGLSFRPVLETLRDEWEWLAVGWDEAASVRAQARLDIPAGMSREREATILAAARESGSAR